MQNPASTSSVPSAPPRLTPAAVALKARPRRVDRLVYASRIKAKARGTHRTVVGLDHVHHLYLNADLPRCRRTGETIAPPHTAVCLNKGRCGHAYAHMMGSGFAVCEECRVQDLAAVAAELQAAGIELGWGATPIDKRAAKMAHGDIQAMSSVRKR